MPDIMPAYAVSNPRRRRATTTHVLSFGPNSQNQEVRSYFLVFVPTIREIRDFYREMQRTNRESITIYRL